VNTLNSKQKKILEDIFKEPVKSDVLWKDIEKVLAALGAEISEGNGSRIRIYLNGIRAVFHRPHPGKQTDKGALKSMRRFLIEAGVRNVKI
jgi:ABC-type phosphate transport system ATPase subunit